MELHGFLSSASTPAILARRLATVKAQSAFGESLCLSQLLAVERVLEEAQEMGWGMEMEIANVKEEIQVMEDFKSSHRRMRRYGRDMVLARTALRGVRSVTLEFLIPDEPTSRRAAPGPYTMLVRYKAPGTGKLWLWAPYTAEAWAEKLPVE